MHGAAWHRAARRDEVRILARAYLISAVVLTFAAAFPYTPTTPRGGLAALAAVVLGLAGSLRVRVARLHQWHVHAALALTSVVVSVLVAMAATPSGAILTTTGYLWIATFSAVFHRSPVLLRHLGLIGVGLAVGLVLADVPSPAQAWFVLVGTVGTVAVVLNSRVLDLRREATTDPLTGLLTRRALHYAAELEMARAERTGQPLTLALLDLDDFKTINDREGHPAGDAVLVGLTQAWRSALRPEDALGRYGGDEFMLVLPRTDLDGAQVVLDHLESDLCGWSYGLAEWTGQGLDEWVTAADQDLYAAKSESGR